MEKPTVSTGVPSAEVQPRDPSVSLELFPELANLVTSTVWPDGSPIGKVCVMLFVDSASVRVLLKLESLGLKTSLVGRTVDDALALLDRALASGQVVWEQDEGPRPAGSKKKK